MAAFSGSQLGITPSATVANCGLQSTSGNAANIKEVSWGGEVTTSTAMRTRLARDSALGTGSATAGNVQKLRGHANSNSVTFWTTYATTQPTCAAGQIVGTSWNAHGGVVRFLLDPSEVVDIYDAAAGTSSIELRQDVGTATSSYSIVWEEH